MPDSPRLSYLREGIRRIATGEVQSGSHAAGIFGRSAADFENAIRSYFVALLSACTLDYETTIRPFLKGTVLEKATLGQLIGGIERAATLRHDCVVSQLPAGEDLESLLSRLREINADWVSLKHRQEVEVSVMLERMKSMCMIWEKLRDVLED